MAVEHALSVCLLRSAATAAGVSLAAVAGLMLLVEVLLPRSLEMEDVEVRLEVEVLGLGGGAVDGFGAGSVSAECGGESSTSKMSRGSSGRDEGFIGADWVLSRFDMSGCAVERRRSGPRGLKGKEGASLGASCRWVF